MKRFLAILCSVMMLINSLPVTAMAENVTGGDPPEIVSNIEADVLLEGAPSGGSEAPAADTADKEEPADEPATAPAGTAKDEEPEEEPAAAPAGTAKDEEPEEEPATAPAGTTEKDTPSEKEPEAPAAGASGPALTPVDGTIQGEGVFTSAFTAEKQEMLLRLNLEFDRKMRFAAAEMDLQVTARPEDSDDPEDLVIILLKAQKQTEVDTAEDGTETLRMVAGSWLLKIEPQQEDEAGEFLLSVKTAREPRTDEPDADAPKDDGTSETDPAQAEDENTPIAGGDSEEGAPAGGEQGEGSGQDLIVNVEIHDDDDDHENNQNDTQIIEFEDLDDDSAAAEGAEGTGKEDPDAEGAEGEEPGAEGPGNEALIPEGGEGAEPGAEGIADENLIPENGEGEEAGNPEEEEEAETQTVFTAEADGIRVTVTPANWNPPAEDIQFAVMIVEDADGDYRALAEEALGLKDGDDAAPDAGAISTEEALGLKDGDDAAPDAGAISTEEAAETTGETVSEDAAAEQTEQEGLPESGPEEAAGEGTVPPEQTEIIHEEIRTLDLLQILFTDGEGNPLTPEGVFRVAFDMSDRNADWAAVHLFRMTDDAAREIAASTEGGLILFETEDFPTFAVAETAKTVTVLPAAEETKAQSEESEPAEVRTGLDPEKVEAWRNGLRAQGYSESAIAQMEETLYAEPDTLQYLISKPLIDALQYDSEINSPEQISLNGPYSGIRKRAAGAMAILGKMAGGKASWNDLFAMLAGTPTVKGMLAGAPLRAGEIVIPDISPAGPIELGQNYALTSTLTIPAGVTIEQRDLRIRLFRVRNDRGLRHPDSGEQRQRGQPGRIGRRQRPRRKGGRRRQLHAAGRDN